MWNLLKLVLEVLEECVRTLEEISEVKNISEICSQQQ